MVPGAFGLASDQGNQGAGQGDDPGKDGPKDKTPPKGDEAQDGKKDEEQKEGGDEEFQDAQSQHTDDEKPKEKSSDPPKDESSNPPKHTRGFVRMVPHELGTSPYFSCHHGVRSTVGL